MLGHIGAMLATQDPDLRLSKLQTSCLSSMKRIGSLSANLREPLKEDLLKQVRPPMRTIIDEVYPEMIAQERDEARRSEIKKRTRVQAALSIGLRIWL